jgi:hypothetical protein
MLMAMLTFQLISVNCPCNALQSLLETFTALLVYEFLRNLYFYCPKIRPSSAILELRQSTELDRAN